MATTTTTTTAGVTFTATGAAKIKKAVAIVLKQNRIGDRTGSEDTERGFFALITGQSLDGLRYTFVRVALSATDGVGDFIMTNGPSYDIIGEYPEQGLAREVNGVRSIPIYSVVWVIFSGYSAADDEPAFMFQWVGPADTQYLPIHDHRDNFNGGLSFSMYHPGTALPQQPWAM